MTLQADKWPSGITGSNYQPQWNLYPFNDSGCLLMASCEVKGIGWQKHWQMQRLAPNGKLLASSKNFPDYAKPQSAAPTSDGGLVVAASLEDYRGAVFHYNPQLGITDSFMLPNGCSLPHFEQGENGKLYAGMVIYNEQTIFGIKVSHGKYPALVIMKQELSGDWSFCSETISDHAAAYDIPKIKVNKNGKVVLVVNETILAGADHHDVELVSFDATGKLLWKKVIKGTGDLYRTRVEDLGIDADGNVYVSLSFDSDVYLEPNTKPILTGVAAPDMGNMVAKYSGSGKLLWHHSTQMSSFILQPNNSLLLYSTSYPNGYIIFDPKSQKEREVEYSGHSSGITNGQVLLNTVPISQGLLYAIFAHPGKEMAQDNPVLEVKQYMLKGGK